MAALTAKQRKAVHAAFGYLAKVSRQIQSSHERKAKHYAQIA
jgi:hypothetical protein